MTLTHIVMMQFLLGAAKGVASSAARRHPGFDDGYRIRRDDAEIMEILAAAVPLLDDC